MKNRYPVQLTAALIFIAFSLGCGNTATSPYLSPHHAQTWTGIWSSSKAVSSGTFSLNLKESDGFFSGSITLSGSPCFSGATIAGWTVSGNAVSWTSPEIGGFSGTVTGGTISGTYSVTFPGACFGDSGVFSITS